MATPPGSKRRRKQRCHGSFGTEGGVGFGRRTGHVYAIGGATARAAALGLCLLNLGAAQQAGADPEQTAAPAELTAAPAPDPVRVMVDPMAEAEVGPGRRSVAGADPLRLVPSNADGTRWLTRAATMVATDGEYLAAPDVLDGPYLLQAQRAGSWVDAARVVVRGDTAERVRVESR